MFFTCRYIRRSTGQSFKPNPSSCPNHSRLTVLQSPPLSQARTVIFTAALVSQPIITETMRCSEDLSDKVRSERVHGYGSDPVSWKNRIRNDDNEDRPVIFHDDSSYLYLRRSNNAIKTHRIDSSCPLTNSVEQRLMKPKFKNDAV
uniref:Uncharacterized protein n=1 Tax=Brassica oleracea var. oleracea TaxID=109376 RepID=A0A0D3EBX3_BRAOL